MSDRVLDVINLSSDIPLAEGMLHAVDGIDIHGDKGETLCNVSTIWLPIVKAGFKLVIGS